MMNKKILIFTLLILTGCSITPETDTGNTLALSAEKQTASTFILKAAEGYVNPDNYVKPHTYLVDTNRNEVYVDIYEEPSEMTPEEIIENAEKDADIVESVHPIFEIESLSADADSFSLQYDSKVVEFSTLSDSYYEDQDGVRYTIDSHDGINDYIESFFEE